MVVQVRTAPYDARFPSMNQARNCYTRYNEFYRCAPPVAHVVHGAHPLNHAHQSSRCCSEHNAVWLASKAANCL